MPEIIHPDISETHIALGSRKIVHVDMDAFYAFRLRPAARKTVKGAWMSIRVWTLANERDEKPKRTLLRGFSVPFSAVPLRYTR